jgi:hypothetical protein
MPDKDCGLLSRCPVFARFKVEAMKGIWIRLYCQGSLQEECKRLQARRRGETPPTTLLPNGDHMG